MIMGSLKSISSCWLCRLIVALQAILLDIYLCGVLATRISAEEPDHELRQS